MPDMGVIVVATDGSPAATAALDEAIAIARQTGDRIAAITVWRALQGDFGLSYPPSALLNELLDAEREHAEGALAEATRRAAAAGLAVEARLATGDPADRVCAYATELGARLIALGTHGYSSVMSLLAGSVSSAVIRRAPCPVLVVHEPDAARQQEAAGHLAAGR